MARRRSDHWLLIRLAAQNVARRRLRALFLGAAVMLGVGIGFAGFVAGWALRDGMATSFSRMGADLLVVPRATLVNITASLLTVQPTTRGEREHLHERRGLSSAPSFVGDRLPVDGHAEAAEHGDVDLHVRPRRSFAGYRRAAPAQNDW